MKRMLLVEDQQTAAHYIAKGLREEGFAVDVAMNGPDGLHLLLTADYDVAILDIMLPGLDGWQILETIRRAGRLTPVLFLTARDDIDDRVRGLDSGAEDYLVKPFAYSELLARLRVILRRHGAPASAASEGQLQVGALTMDLLRHRVTRGGDRIELTPKEFALLRLLMTRAGEVLSRTVLATQVWDINFDSDSNVVEVAIKRLRSKIDDPYETKLLHTVRGAGYVLDAERS
ncbi:MAG: Two-component system, OmpR family, copper resistance phosphate regulon response regulator CusR [Ramlibacter sp.]|nr:Two-component system, OmpR family, copper resistance phosphate regulon response regulator CusR [Ramlibacter sp.]